MIIQRLRIKHEKTFKEGLAEEAARFTELAGQTPPGMQRELYLRQAQQAATASYEREWRVLGPVGEVGFGNVQAVRAIYFGSRVDRRQRKRILAKIEGTSIRAFMMDVDGYKHTFRPIDAAARPKKD